MCAVIISHPKVPLDKFKDTTNLKVKLRDSDPIQAPLVNLLIVFW